MDSWYWGSNGPLYKIWPMKLDGEMQLFVLQDWKPMTMATSSDPVRLF